MCQQSSFCQITQHSRSMALCQKFWDIPILAKLRITVLQLKIDSFQIYETGNYISMQWS